MPTSAQSLKARTRPVAAVHHTGHSTTFGVVRTIPGRDVLIWSRCQGKRVVARYV